MKYANCPICEWTLGIPDKLLGHPVTCPKCEKIFLPTVDTAAQGKPEKKKRKRKNKPLPAPRSIPAPTAVTASSSQDAEKNLASVEKSGRTDLDPPSFKSRDMQETATPPTELLPPTPPASADSQSDRTVSTSQPSPASQTVARIIQAEPEPEELGADGTLPTLQLKEDQKKKVDSREFKSNPVFLALVICGSVLSSGLMLFFADFGQAPDQQVLDNARQEIRQFYSVRTDVQLKPYQLELREAQLAHSRKDRDGEIAAYRKVMARFRAEDKSKFAGVTGSPTSDIKLEALVSVLLGDGRDRSRR